MQAPHNHEIVIVVHWVPDGHVLEDLTVGSQDVVRPGTHYPPLTHRCPRPPIPTSRPPLREEVSHNILKTCRCHHRRDLFIPSPSTRLLKVHIQATHNNQLCPSCLLRHSCLHVSNCRPVSWHQATPDGVPAPLSCHQLARDEVRAKLAYRIECEGGGVPI